MPEFKELAAALVKFQASISSVAKNAENPFFKSSYADLAQVKRIAQPHLKEAELAVAQFPTHVDGEPALRSMLVHSSGQYIEDTMLLVMVKKDPQGQGSAMTYARRYAYMAILGLVADEDDDGNSSIPPKPTVTTEEKVLNVMTDEVPAPVATVSKQQFIVRGLLSRLGMPEEARKRIISQITTPKQGADAIEQLEEKVARMEEEKNKENL
jgi:ERF superfamily protein